MKAVVEVGPSNIPDGVQSGRVSRKRNVENEEIQMYLSKLKDLVPFMPKNRKLSKLEVIRYVIDYICDLQYTLDCCPDSTVNIESGELAARLQGEPTVNGTTFSGRQPLGTLAHSPNAIVRPSSSNSPLPQVDSTVRSMSPLELEKTQETDVRPISC